MGRDSVTVEARIDAPIGVVWRLLTADRDAWWSEMRFEAAVGSALLETWIEEGRPASATGTITRCDEPTLLGFTWTEPTWVQPLDVVIRLVADGSSTSVALTESGFSRAQAPPSLAAEHEEGWRYHLTRWARASEGEAVGPS